MEEVIPTEEPVTPLRKYNPVFKHTETGAIFILGKNCSGRDVTLSNGETYETGDNVYFKATAIEKELEDRADESVKPSSYTEHTGGYYGAQKDSSYWEFIGNYVHDIPTGTQYKRK